MSAGAADAARLGELARRASQRAQTVFSEFLDPAQAALAQAAARGAQVLCALWGGYPEAERQVAAFYIDDAPGQWPVACVRIQWDARFAAPGHRDLLGAILSLGLERDRLGDIWVGEGAAHIFSAPDIAEYIVRTLDSVGRARVVCAPAEGAPDIPTPEGRNIRGTVASLRMDAVLAAAFEISRTRAAELIGRGLVRLNHRAAMRPDGPVGAGDLISVRGLGRARVQNIPGMTRKGRIAVEFFRYGT